MFLVFFNLLSTSKCFVSFEVTLSLIVLNFVSKYVFFTKLITYGILFSTAVNAALVAALVMLVILSSTSVILELSSVFLTKSLT